MNVHKILIVDDEWLIRSELRNMLNQYPHIQVVGEAGSVDEAVHIVQKTNPDVIFLDIQMPGQSGFDLLEQINTGYKIVFVSAFIQYREAAKKYQPVDYLLKPISKVQLAQVMKKIHPFPQGDGMPSDGTIDLATQESK